LEDILSHHQLNSNALYAGEAEIGCHTMHHCEPLFNDETYDEANVLTVLKLFGFKRFRPGQCEAIKRILCGNL